MLHVQAIPLNTGSVYGPARSHRKPQLRAGPRAAKLCAHSYTSSAEWQKENPSFDDIVLNDEYYASLGISPEELADQLSFQADDVDPEGQDIGMDGPVGEGSPSFLHDQDLDIDVWGPEVRQAHLLRYNPRHLSRILTGHQACRLWSWLASKQRSVQSYAARWTQLMQTQSRCCLVPVTCCTRQWMLCWRSLK